MSKKKKIVLVIAILLVIGAGVGFYFYNKKKQAESAPEGAATTPGSSLKPGITFDEQYYLANNPDVAAAVKNGDYGLTSGYQHYQNQVATGKENRPFRFI